MGIMIVHMAQGHKATIYQEVGQQNKRVAKYMYVFDKFMYIMYYIIYSKHLYII